MLRRFWKRWFRNTGYNPESLGDRRLAECSCAGRPARRSRQRFYSPVLEYLEERLAPATLTVTNPTDAAVDGETSLRQALVTANTDAAAGQSDTITFEPSLGSATVLLTQGPLVLSGAGTGTITIDGSSPSMPLTISGFDPNTSTVAVSPLFQIDSGVQAVLTNLNLENGTASSGTNGGAIVNGGTLTVSNTNLHSNSAASGGAMENTGTLTVSNDVFTSNTATATGGAIDSSGTLTVTDSTFSANGAVNGGAIASAGTLTVANTTFTSNTASGSGGAIDSAAGAGNVAGSFFIGNDANSGGAIDSQAMLNLNGSTFSGNGARLAGSAVANGGTLTADATTISDNNPTGTAAATLDNASGPMTLTDVTVSGNTYVAIANGGSLTLQSTTVSANQVSGLSAIDNAGGTLTLQNSIVAGNSNTGSSGDIAGVITTDDGYNLLGTADNNNTTNPRPGPHDVFSDKPGLAALGNYGGQTQTMAVLSGSPAIGAGNAGAANLPDTDQRGLPRTVSGSLDIGAFQSQAPALVFTTLGQTVTAGQTATITVQLQDLDGDPEIAGSSGVTVTVGTSSSGGSFFDAFGNPLAGNTITIPAGASSATFEYADTDQGTPTLTATASGFATATQQESILPGPVSNTPVTDIVVGRTLSAYFTGEVQNNQVTITLTVYNQQATSITGVLLTDTLAPGVTLVSASQQPDQDGQNLAWSLGTIEGDYWTSLSITVSLANSSILQLDTGAQAFATLNAGPISNSTPAAVLTQGSANPNLLASTPDANTTDPYIQEEAAALSYNPQYIFAFIQQNIGYNSYTGSVRGARGTLWSDAGNALDVASLGVALLRASGIPAQYVEGTLSQSQEQQLILSMFPTSYQTVGYIPAGMPTSDPADDTQLQTETANHYWFEFNTGSGWVNADPLMPGTRLGQIVTAATGSFTQVPGSLREKTEVSLTVETYSQAAALFGIGDGLSDTVVLSQTFNDVDLVGRPIGVGNFVSGSGLGGIFSTTTYTYQPYFDLGDDAYPDAENDAVITGQSYQDIFTNFPLSTQVVTGIFLNVTLSGPEGASETYAHTIFDRIGYAARAGLVTPNISVNGNSPPAVSTLDVTVVNVLAGLENPNVSPLEAEALSTVTSQLNQLVNNSADSADSSQDFSLLTGYDSGFARLLGEEVIAKSESLTAQLASSSDVIAYFDRPQVVVTTVQVASGTSGQAATEATSIDLLRDSIRTVLPPKQASTATIEFNLMRGFSENAVETMVGEAANPNGAAISTEAIFAAAQQQGIPIVSLFGTAATAQLDALGLSPDASAQITASLQSGLLVLVPSSPVSVGGQKVVGWYQINPATGVTTDMLQNGAHSFFSYAAVVSFVNFLIRFGVAFGFGYLAAVVEGAVVKLVKQVTNLNSLLGPRNARIVGYLEIAAEIYATYEIVEAIAESDPGLVPFYIGYVIGLGVVIASLLRDPPLPEVLVNPQGAGQGAVNQAAASINGEMTTAGGNVDDNEQTSALQITGALPVTWQGDVTSSFEVQSFNAASATITNSSGNVLGSGTVGLSTPNPVTLAVAGNNDYSVDGAGTLSFFGPSESNLGVAGDWSNYAAKVTGNLAITVTTDGLTLNGQTLPAGTYTITTSSATLAGSGESTSPSFSGSVSINATGSTISMAPGSGSVTVGGNLLNPRNGITLDGYAGSITVTAGGANDTDGVALMGNASNVLTIAAAPGSLTTKQNTPVTFQANVNTSLADIYTLTAQAPPEWTVSIDSSGKVTVTPAPGVQAGTYPIQVSAQSSSDPNLVAQTTIYITITPTQPGMTFAVNPDPEFTVPYDGAQVPTAFQATIQNTGSAADTYNLTIANVPAGFTVVSSAASDTVPAGQTGIIGIYLVPVAGSTLPAPGTPLSFQVTGTSATNSAITQTVTVTFTMPAIDAVTIASNPVEVSALPGQPAAATVTLQNVGNVAASAGLTFTTDSGLTLTGLTASPIDLAIGQTATETVQLTPDADVPLNSTLQATVNVGPAVAQNEVSVVNVNPSTSFAEAGQTITVSADVLNGLTATEQAQASFKVLNSSDAVVFTSTAMPLTLSTLTNVTTVNLGPLDTSPLTPGQYTIQVSIADSTGTPIPGATGTASLVIDAPVTASLAVSSDAISPDDSNTVLNTLTVGSHMLLGSVATDGAATSVALDGNLAYVANTQDIAVVNVSDPTNPQIVTTFGSSDVNQGGVNLLQLDGNNLVVASENPSDSTSFNLLVYALTNPNSPQLLSNTTIPYAFPADLVVQGNTAFIPIEGIRDDGNGDITDQFGDFLAVNLSNPAAPLLASVLFNNRGSPEGSDSNQADAVSINNQITYVAGSTSTGANTQSGSGQLLIVNTANPAAMSVAGTLAIPGTVQALAIAVNGNEALVVGSSGGYQNPYSDPSQIGLTGNVTLTLLNISNPLAPTIIGSTVVTQDTFPNVGENATGKMQAVYLGNGQFAVSDTQAGGGPILLLVNASNPSNLTTSTVAASADINGMTVAGDHLLVTSGAGLSIYQIPALASQSVTASVTVPTTGTAAVVSNSFSVPPNQVIPGSGTETLVWDLTLAPGAGSQQITWETILNGLAAGQVVAVASGATIQDGNQQYTLPASNVAGIPETQTIEIPVEVAAPGVPAIENAAVAAAQAGKSDLSDQLNNLGTALTNLVQTPTSAVYQSQAVAAITSLVSLVTIDPFQAPFAAGLTAGGTAIANVTTATEVQTAVTNLGTALDALAQAITDEAAHGFTLSLANPEGVIQPGAPTIYTIQMQNTGSATTTYDFSISGLPAGVTATFSQPSITLVSGAAIPAGLTTVSLTLSESGTTLIPANFTISATAEGASEITRSTPGQLDLRSESLLVGAVSATPPFTDAGGLVDITAKIESVVNEPRQVSVSYTVKDVNGNVLFTDTTPVSVPLSLTTILTPVDLGTFSTTGFADGPDTITVTVTDQSSQPLPSASGVGSVTIGSPVTATLTASPATLPVGAGTVTNTLQVNSSLPLPDPLTVDGSVATTPDTTVALYQDTIDNLSLAYVSGPNGIAIVNVTSPSTPVDLGTFGQGDIVNGGLTIGRVVNVNGTAYLVVGTTATLNANQFTLLVYSLNTPTSPQLDSSTPIDYQFPTEMLVQGTTILVPMGGLNILAGGLTLEGQFGTLLSIDISNPAAPTLSDELYNQNGSPDGGDSAENGGVLVNSQLAYIATTTGAGDNFEGMGQVMVVNYSDPTNLSVVSQVDIPGTVDTLDVGFQGNLALVVSATDGPNGSRNSPAPNLFPLAGNLAVSVLDITDPSNPTVLGTTLVTDATFDQTGAVGKLSVLPLGNGLFAVSEGIVNGTPQLLLVDALDPNNIVVTYTPVPALVDEMAVANNLLYTTSAQGLTIYNIGQLETIPVTVSVQVPNNTGVAVVPSSLSVSGAFNTALPKVVTGTTFDTVTWTGVLTYGASDVSVSWQSTVSNLTAGQVLPVTTSGSVGFVSQGTPGTVTLPGTAVTGVSFIAVSPASQTVQPAGTVTYDVQLTNPTDAEVTYDVSEDYNFFTDNFLGGVVINAGNPEVTVEPGATVDIPVQITVDAEAPAGPEPVTVEASTRNGNDEPDDTAQATLIVAGPSSAPDPVAYGVVAALTPSQATAGQGTSTQYVIQVTNTGSADDQYTLQLNGLPARASYTLDQNYVSNGYIDVPPGASNFRDVTITVTVDQDTKPGSYPFTVTATNILPNTPSFSGTANGTLTVDANGVSVSLDKSSGAPGDTFEMTVTNTGTVTDTYTLAVAAPAALVATLAQNSVTLAPGAQQTVAITTKAVTFADQGKLALIATATAQANPAVVGSAMANLVIPTSVGMTAQFSPTRQTLVQVGPASFLLLVNNVGNLQDSYSATITGSTGPVTAHLTGLDGQPAQSVPIFILPGLSTGAILLNANLTGPSAATVTVQVSSLDQPGITSSSTADINASSTLTTMTGVTSDHPTGSTYGQTVTFTATVSASSGTPTGKVQFQLDGANYGTPVTLTGGMTGVAIPGLSAGQYHVTAFYTSNSSSFSGSDNSANPWQQTVQAAPLTITANDQTMTYGGTLPTLTAKFTGLVNGDTPSTFAVSPKVPPTLGTVPATSHAGHYAITVSASSDSNYSITFVPGTLTINPAALTITANNQTMTYGGTLPTLTASFNGLVNGDASATFNASPNIPPTLGTVPATSPAGAYAITVSGASDPDYSIRFVNGTLTINPDLVGSEPPAITSADATTFTVGQFGSFTITATGSPPLTLSESGALPADVTFVDNGNGTATLSGTPAVTTQGIYGLTLSAANGVTPNAVQTFTLRVGRLETLLGQYQQTGLWFVSQSVGDPAHSPGPAEGWAPSITWADVNTGDFNSDGFTDFVGRDVQTGQWFVALSNGHDQFTTTLWDAWSPGVTWADVKVGDVTGDGKDDLVGRDLQTGQWFVAVSTGSAFYTRLWDAWSPGVTWVDVQLGDVTGDGKADIIGRVQQTGQWWVGVSTGNAFSTSLWGAWNPNVTWVDVQLGDFTGDGKLDLVGRVLESGQWWVGLSTGTSFINEFWDQWSTAYTWVDVKVGDLNGDGKADIIGRALENGQWWAGLSTGSSFATSYWDTWSTAVTWVDVQIGDFNGDGLMDIVGRALENGQWWVGISTGAALATRLWDRWDTTPNWVNVHDGIFG